MKKNSCNVTFNLFQSSAAQINLLKKSTITRKQTHRSVSTSVLLKLTDLSTGSW